MLILIFICLLFLYGLVSGRLERTMVTAPMLFTCAGMLVYLMLYAERIPTDSGSFLAMAEMGLVLLLFTDASRIDLKLLRHIKELPVRLLSVGTLLTIILGAVVAKLVFPQFSLWEAGILSTILAPTDAGLGQIIVSSPYVPMRVRQALNVEAGLNDGLCVPFLLFFLAMAPGVANEASFIRFMAEQLGLGIVLGALIGFCGGWLLNAAKRSGWMSESFLQLAVVALPAFCYLLSDHIHASMFIAAFVAGLFVQMPFRDAAKHGVQFTEEWGQILNLSVFFLFGLIVSGNFGQFGITHLIYALLSLTLVRMLPVAASLAGCGLDKKTIVFMGWFGPRGLASIVLGLVYLEKAQDMPGKTDTRIVVIATVLLSIFAHGLTALHGVRWLSGNDGAACDEKGTPT